MQKQVTIPTLDFEDLQLQLLCKVNSIFEDNKSGEAEIIQRLEMLGARLVFDYWDSNVHQLSGLNRKPVMPYNSKKCSKAHPIQALLNCDQFNRTRD